MMTKNNECDLLAAINSLPDDVSWLIRSDEEQGFMVNIMSPEFSVTGGWDGMANHAYASTPVQAFEDAYRGYKAQLN